MLPTTNTVMFFNISIFLAILGVGISLDYKITNETLSILKSSYVHMKNESAVFEKINEIVHDGVNKLQFIMDFDQTVTKQHENGVSTMHSVGVFFQSKQIPEESLKTIKSALYKFGAFEFNNTIGKAQQLRIFKELTELVQQKLQGFEFDRKEIKNIVHKYGPPVRNRTSELFTRLKNLNIPVVIYSAGLSDVVEEQLRQENVNYDNIKVIANHLKFNGSMLGGIENYENSINAFNKYEVLSHHVKSEDLKSRKNIILMGDHVGDAEIVRGFENEGTVLKVGFFYNLTRDSLEIYKEAFDVVLDDDQTMNVILDILKLF